MTEPTHIKTVVETVLDNIKNRGKRTERMFVYLDELRESGVTNMFGAAPYLQNEFGLDKHEAREVLSMWMKTFSERHPK
jgi:hypothetical protein